MSPTGTRSVWKRWRRWSEVWDRSGQRRGWETLQEFVILSHAAVCEYSKQKDPWELCNIIVTLLYTWPQYYSVYQGSMLLLWFIVWVWISHRWAFLHVSVCFCLSEKVVPHLSHPESPILLLPDGQHLFSPNSICQWVPLRIFTLRWTSFLLKICCI